MLYIYICMKALERDHKVNEMKVEISQILCIAQFKIKKLNI